MRLPRRLVQPLALVTFAAASGCSDDLDSIDFGDVDADADVSDATSDATPDADVTGDAGPDAVIDVGTDVNPDGSGEGSGDPIDRLDWCGGATAHRWDPLAPRDPDFFPDGMLMAVDEDSPTGLRIEINAETAPWSESIPKLLKQSLLSMNRLSGFGTMGGALLRFTAPVADVPADAAASLEDEGWQWWDLSAVPPRRVPFEARVLEDGLTVVLWPLRPLESASEHAIVVTTQAVGADGGCIAPAPTTMALLHDGEEVGLANAERIVEFAPAYQAAVSRLGYDPTEISAITVYTTNDDLLPIRDAAERVVEQPVEWGEAGDCVERGDLLECEASTTVLDYRDERGMVDGSVEPREGVIPVTYWIPADASGPLPVVVYGHGLNSLRREGYEIAQRLSGLGFVVIAMEAVEHGEHPFIDPEEGGEAALRFLGINLDEARIDAERINGNFTQTSIDRLRLIHLIRTDGDIDNDGTVELDSSRVSYLGVSLGALCGTSLLAMSPDIDAGILSIGGARLMSIVTDTEMVASLRPLIAQIIGSAERFDRLVPIAQHVVDVADPGIWAAHILTDRFDGRAAPSVLANFGMFDEIVPPSAGRALARALGAPHLAPVAVPIELVDVLESGPIVGNREDGARTAAFFQFDQVTRDGETRPAEHIDTAKCDENAAQIRAFLAPWAAGEVPAIIDPYID